MQKVRYCLSSNSLNIKFQFYFSPPFKRWVINNYFQPVVHTTCSLSILDLLTLEIDFPMFNRRSTFYGLLKIVTKHVGKWKHSSTL
jgi:hypothetical protein